MTLSPHHGPAGLGFSTCVGWEGLIKDWIFLHTLAPFFLKTRPSCSSAFLVSHGELGQHRRHQPGQGMHDQLSPLLQACAWACPVCTVPGQRLKEGKATRLTAQAGHFVLLSSRGCAAGTANTMPHDWAPLVGTMHSGPGACAQHCVDYKDSPVPPVPLLVWQEAHAWQPTAPQLSW